MIGKSIAKDPKSQTKKYALVPAVYNEYTQVDYWRERYREIRKCFSSNREVAEILQDYTSFYGWSGASNITYLFKGKLGLNKTVEAVSILEQHAKTLPKSLLSRQKLVKKN